MVAPKETTRTIDKWLDSTTYDKMPIVIEPNMPPVRAFLRFLILTIMLHMNI